MQEESFEKLYEKWGEKKKKSRWGLFFLIIIIGAIFSVWFFGEYIIKGKEAPLSNVSTQIEKDYLKVATGKNEYLIGEKITTADFPFISKLDIQGYLRIKLQKEVGGKWIDVTTLFDDLSEGYTRTIPAGELYGVWLEYEADEEGLFNIHAMILNQNGEVIKINESSLEANYTFKVVKRMCDYPFCDLTPRIYDLTASNNPQEYIGNIIAWERPSDWKNYKPLVEKVGELTKGLTTNYDKMVAIYKWVRNTHPFDHSPANEYGTVIDIFDSTTGVCLDHAILISAMLRIAGIPARMIGYAFHAEAEAYIDGKWTITPGTGDYENVSSQLASYTPWVTIKPVGQFENVRDKVSGTIYSRLYVYRRKIIEPDWAKTRGIKFGTVVYPVSAKTLYLDNDNEARNFYNRDFNLTWIGTWIEPTDKSCLEYANILDFEDVVIGDLYYWGDVTTYGIFSDGGRKVSGYYKHKLPTCKYRLHYNYHPTLDLNRTTEVAYQDFEIIDGDTIKIEPSSLKKLAGISENNFNVLVQTLKELPPFEQL